MITHLIGTLNDLCFAEERGHPVRPLAMSAVQALQIILLEQETKIDRLTKRIEALERK